MQVTKNFNVVVVVVVVGLKKCYPPYGCFTNQKPWNLIWHVLPKSPRVMRTLFELYTRKNRNGKKVNPFRVRSSGLDGRKKTIFIIHGWKGLLYSISLLSLLLWCHKLVLMVFFISFTVYQQ